jgi:hypothetical protein
MATRPIPAKKAPAKKVAAPKPTAAAPKKKAAPAVVVTLKAVFEQLGETHDLPKKQVHAMMSELVAAVTAHLKKGAKLRMSGLGTLAGGPDGPQSSDRRGDQDQGQQEDRIPAGQRAQGGNVGSVPRPAGRRARIPMSRGRAGG